MKILPNCLYKNQLICPSNQQLAPTLTEQHQGQTSTKAHHSSTSISIIDALNYFSEFKIFQPEAVNEPVMLCNDCYAELANCVHFRKKLNESEFLLRKNFDASDTEEDSKTGLTMQMVDIKPFLAEEESSSENSSQEILKSSKVHHAKPRFQLTNQVSNILRHVTATRCKSSGINANENLSHEKRKESDNQSSSKTPKKMQRTNSPPSLEDTLIVPYYIFKDEKYNKAHGVQEESNESPESYHTPEMSCKRVDKDDIFHCKHCQKAFSTAQYLANHTKNVHRCQHCSKHFPTILAKNKHNREEHRSFRCTLCSFQSRYAANLKVHLRNMHPLAPSGDVGSQRQQDIQNIKK